MKILSLYKITESTYIAFIALGYAGRHVHEARLLTSDGEFANTYSSLIYTDYKTAHEKAYLQIMSQEDYILYKPKL